MLKTKKKKKKDKVIHGAKLIWRTFKNWYSISDGSFGGSNLSSKLSSTVEQDLSFFLIFLENFMLKWFASYIILPTSKVSFVLLSAIQKYSTISEPGTQWDLWCWSLIGLCPYLSSKRHSNIIWIKLKISIEYLYLV